MSQNMYIYIIQIFTDMKLLHINYEFTNNHSDRLSLLRKKKLIKDAKLRMDLVDNKNGLSVDEAKIECNRLATKLIKQGYIPLDGGGILKSYWQTYVINVDKDKSNTLYVGQTNYPVFMRFLQHTNGIRTAKIFKTNTPISLAKEHMDNLRYYNQDDAKVAESKLAEELRKKGYKVYGGH
jgi:hypothetical protein